MKTFNKTNANNDFDHQLNIVKIFSELGFNELKIKTVLTNGISNYVNVLDFEVLNSGRLYSEMFCEDDITFITVRISDHTSNLDTICNGVNGNTMNLQAFKKLIENGAIAPKK